MTTHTPGEVLANVLRFLEAKDHVPWAGPLETRIREAIPNANETAAERDRLKALCDELTEALETLANLADESKGGPNVPRGEYVAFQLRLGNALNVARAALAKAKESA